MHLITWLEKNLEVYPNSKVGTDEVLMAVNEKRLAHNLDSVSKNLLGRIINNLFRVKSKTLREDGGRVSYYMNLKFRQDSGDESRCNLSDIPLIVTGYGWITERNDAHVKVLIQSGLVVNHHPVMLNISFLNDNSWTLHVGDVEIDLESIMMSTIYESRRDVMGIVNIVRKLRLCKGKKKPDRVVVRTNVVEHCSEDSVTYQCVRTEACTRVLPFTVDLDTFTCCSCQKVKVTKPLVETDFIQLDDQDAKDMATILDAVLPDASEELKALILEQQRILKAKGPTGNRWSRKTIQLALTIWTRNPAAYEDLKNSGFIRLPSKQLLRLYKNAVPQESGLNPKVLDWMRREAERQNIPPHGMRGGVLFDEMSIEEDIQTVRQGQCLKLVGFVDCGHESENLNVIKHDSTGKNLANHVLQFQFLGYSGFRFPFAHNPTRGATATELFILFWDAVAILESYGFVTDYVNLDGAITNRQFLNMNFQNVSAKHTNYRATSLVNPTHSVHFIMDIKHSLKKIRNNILNSSASDDGTRCLNVDDTKMTWSLWQEAYEWDCKNPCQIHNHLTHNHIHLDGASKMRNHLAEECLNADMLQLMMEYKESLGDHGHKLDAAIELLKQTSVLVSIFNDRRPIMQATDERLGQLQCVQAWFEKWEEAVTSSGMSRKDQRASLMSSETRNDLDSSILGFISLCKDRFKAPDFHSVNPSRINSDVIENNFCQQRGLHNGSNTNPTYSQYKSTMNSIILGQGTVSTTRSKKGNAWKRAAEPYSFSSPEPLVPKSKRKQCQDITNTI